MTKPRAKIRAVLFDLGDTLVDLRDFDGWVEVARRFYVDVDADGLRHAYLEVETELDGHPSPDGHEGGIREFWRATLSRASRREVAEETVGRFLAALRATAPSLHLFSDVRRCLDELAAQRRLLGVVSNSESEASVRALLDRVGILSYFARLVSSGTEGVEKPDPEIFRRAVERLAVRPEETVYVGNLARTDAEGARAAGLHGIWLNREGWGYGEDPPEVTSLLEVPLWIRQFEARP